MADIFISYAREDRAIAERLASAIEASGKSVWWDRHIKGGAQFSKDIERELAAAAHVLVLWSKSSVESRWVRDEATEAADDERLIGASIDGTMAPLGFRQFHTVDLQEWAKTGAALPEELAEAFGGTSAAPTSSAPPLQTPKSKKPLIIAGTAIALALAGGAYVATDGFSGTRAEQSATASLAVMPFTTLGSDDLAYLGPGMAGAISNDLGQLEGLQLTASSSASALAGQGLTATQIGEQLGVAYLVEGQLTASGDNLRAEVSLIDTATARQIWSRSYTKDAGRSQQLTNEITRDLAAALQSRLNVGGGRIAAPDNVNPRAYEAYLRAREAQTDRFEGNNRREAYDQYRRAIELDPDFADAHAGLAYLISLSSGATFGFDREEQPERLRVPLERALELDPDNLLARAARINGKVLLTGELREALALSEELVSDAPDFGPGLYASGGVLDRVGEIEGAVDHLKRATRVDPFNRNIQNAYIRALRGTGDYNRIANYFRECTNCASFFGEWTAALATLGDEQQYERDWPTVSKIALDDGAPEDLVQVVGDYVRDIVTGKRSTMPQVLHGNTAMILGMRAYSGEEETILEMLEEIFGNTTPGAAFEFTYPGRSQPSEAFRADPRYHALFDNPVLAEAVEIRRENGQTEGLPVFPVKPYEGP